MRVSIRQVAKHANVSSGTVSNVLRGHDSHTSPATRKIVLEAVRELGYIPVAQPGSQRRHRETKVIGLVFDIVDLEDDWGLPTFRGIRQSAREHGYDVLTILRAPADWMLDKKELQFLDRRGDGFIFVVPVQRDRVFEALVQHEIPVVSCFLDDVPAGVKSVVLDNAGAMRQAVNYLIAHGHRKIAHFAGIGGRADFRARRHGYEEAMQAAGLLDPELCYEFVEGRYYRDQAKVMLEFVQQCGATALVCATDDFALAFWDHAEAAGLRIPQDLSLIGMDDIPEAQQRGLTTLRSSSQDLGRRAADTLVQLIKGDSAVESRQIVPVELVERTTVAVLAPTCD